MGFFKVKKSRAFSLLEVLIAVFIFTIAILAIIGNLPWLLASSKVTQMYTAASLLSERYMEELQSDPDYTSLETNYNDTYLTRRNIAGFASYKACLKVEAVSGTSNDLKKITVIIFWYAQKKEHSFTLVNLRKRG